MTNDYCLIASETMRLTCMSGECYLFCTPWGHISPYMPDRPFGSRLDYGCYCIPPALQIKPVCPGMMAYRTGRTWIC